MQCSGCKREIPFLEMRENAGVCPYCGHGEREVEEEDDEMERLRADNANLKKENAQLWDVIKRWEENYRLWKEGSK